MWSESPLCVRPHASTIHPKNCVVLVLVEGGDRTEKLDSGETCSKSVRLDLPAQEGKRDAFFLSAAARPRPRTISVPIP